MRKWMFGFFAAAAIAGAAPLQADDELFDKLDANKDGFISLDEVDGEAKAKLERVFRTSDKNEDKKLSKEEFAAGLKQQETPRTPVEGAERRRPGGAPGQDAKEFFARADANKDGKLSKDEAPERLKANFDRLDANKDGFIDQEEFARMAGRGAEGRGPAEARRPDGAPARRPEGAPDRRPEGRPEAGRPEGRPSPGMMPLVRALDADGDGEISADEIKNAAAALAKLDKNGDGKLTRDEMLPPPPRPGERRPGEGRPDGARPPEGRRPEGRRPDGERRRPEGEKPAPPKND